MGCQLEIFAYCKKKSYNKYILRKENRNGDENQCCGGSKQNISQKNGADKSNV